MTPLLHHLNTHHPFHLVHLAKFRSRLALRSNQTCGILGLSTSENSSLHGDRASNLIPLTESSLQTLLDTYHQGHVFSTGERGTYQKKEKRRSGKKSEQSAANTLRKIFPSVRSIVFVPLWDPNRGRRLAGSSMWTVVPTNHVLTLSGDLNYLATFGNSIMAEVARLDVVGTDRAKSDFISSISHELRSPLHGILASSTTRLRRKREFGGLTVESDQRMLLSHRVSKVQCF